MEIEKRITEEIIKLHTEIFGGLKVCLDKAIRIGELLTEQKETLDHGNFTPWIKANLPFTDRTARNYMRVYRERDRLKTETVSDLRGAYKLLAPPKEEKPEEEKFWSYPKPNGTEVWIDFKTWINGATNFELRIATAWFNYEMEQYRPPPEGYEDDPDYAPPSTAKIEHLQKLLEARNVGIYEGKTCQGCHHLEMYEGDKYGRCFVWSYFIPRLPTDPACEYWGCSWEEFHRINDEKKQYRNKKIAGVGMMAKERLSKLQREILEICTNDDPRISWNWRTRGTIDLPRYDNWANQGIYRLKYVRQKLLENRENSPSFRVSFSRTFRNLYIKNLIDLGYCGPFGWVGIRLTPKAKSLMLTSKTGVDC